MNKIARFFIFLAKLFFLIAFAILFFNGIFLKPILSSSLGLYWNTDVSIQRAGIDWSLPGIVVKEIKVGNPYGFPRGDMLEIAQVTMKFNQSRDFLTHGALKPALLTIQIRKIELMRRVSGHLNLALFVNPENTPTKKRGFKLVPYQTRILVEKIHETDISTPLLQKQDYPLEKNEFWIWDKPSFRIIAQTFAKELFQRIGLSEEGNVPVLPAPQFHGIVSAVEQEIRDHAEKSAKDDADAKNFETMTETKPPAGA